MAHLKPYLFSSLALAIALSSCTPSGAAPARITVDTASAGKPVSPLLYGIFFEEINRAGDGGIYAEMIQNRSFEDSRTLFHDEARRQELGEQAIKESDDAIAWTVVKSGTAEGGISLDRNQPLNSNNPTSLKLTVAQGGGRVGISNQGFAGIPIGTGERTNSQNLATWHARFNAATNGGIAVEQGKTYDLSIYSRALQGAGTLTATLETADGKVLAKQSLGKPGTAWKKVDVALKPNATETQARLVIAAETPGTYWLDMVSLFPHDTWKGRKNGLRADLMDTIAAIHPAFVRFPGGCFVEGRGNEWPRWKDSIGDIANRPEGSAYWGYALTNGLGFHEYLQMCEDLGAQPLFVINCGMHHAARGGGMAIEPMEKMDAFVQDALDALEYANGPVTSKWGAERAKNGHPAPFNLRMMEIGNENGGRDYNARYALFNDAIKAKYPDVQLVACDWGGVPNNRTLDLIDSHHYGNPASMLRMVNRYDTTDRNGPHIYFGEYAVTQQSGKGNVQAAVAEAAFMTGLERNGDIVKMSSYAPLLVRKGWDRWNPNAIMFDQSRVYGTPSYWVQTMFGANRPDRTFPTEVGVGTQAESIRGGIGVGTWGTQAEFKDIKVTKGDQTLLASNFTAGTTGWKTPRGQWSVVDGALRQSSNENNAIALIGDPTWTDYTLTLKARKISGNEGFLITFGSPDDGATTWWNLGGWNNTAHGVEYPGVNAPRVNGKIETGRWYDIKIELSGATAKLYLDGQLVQTVTRDGLINLNAIAGVDAKTGETILKVVNSGATPIETSVALNGAKATPLTGTAWVLGNPSGTLENTFEAPLAVAPQKEKVALTGPTFDRVFPPQSVTVLRLKSGK